MKLGLKILVMVLLLPVTVPAAQIEVLGTSTYRKENSSGSIYAAELGLPATGLWRPAKAMEGNDKERVYLLAPRDKIFLADITEQERNGEKALAQRNQGVLRSTYSSLKKYADEHGNIGPRTLGDLEVKSPDKNAPSATPPRPAVSVPIARESEVFLIPEVEFATETGKNQVPPSRKKLLLIERRPYFNDGKQWKLYTDGSCLREDIDRDLLTKYNLTISPVTDGKGVWPEEKQAKGEINTYTLLVVGEQKGKASSRQLTFEDTLSGEKLTLNWSPDPAAPSNPELSRLIAYARYQAWMPYWSLMPNNPLYKTWLEKMGWKTAALEARRGSGRTRPDRDLSAFNVLGGRAAVEETLQLQGLATAGNDGVAETIPVASIKGVEVKAHPFETMLAGAKGGNLPLADFVPPDHFFVYSPKPATILPLLDEGAGFMAKLGGIIEANGIDYDLKNRYLTRLGLDNGWMQKFIKSGAVSESAFIFPDLFFIEGTEVTVVSRLAYPKLAAPLLRLVGIGSLAGGKIFTKSLVDGRKVLWALRDDILIISSSPAEMDGVLALHGAGGQGSLGKSAEFAYMLTQTPVNPETRCYAYFSDPFIRHLVSPATKIGQLRRQIVRRNLEELTAAMLLARLDGYSGLLTPAGLVKAGYADPPLAGGDFSIDKDGAARSAKYGTLAELRPLASVPVENITETEAATYKRYLENYNNYWRQFFDPIAIRLDDTEDGGLELTTFILPLLDNSIYRAVKEVVANRENGKSLTVPVTNPAPVVMFSLNLTDKVWQTVVKDGRRFFSEFSPVDAGILSDLGPSLHLAVMDADPVVALGSGDVLGAFNAGSTGLARGGEMLFVPLAMSVLTRPCAFYIETANPAKTLQYLRRATSTIFSSASGRNGIETDFYQISGQDEWVCAVKLFGVVKLRYSIEVRNNFLVVRNIPWANREEIERVQAAQLNGAQLQLFPKACTLQLPGIFASAAEQERRSTQQGMGYLYPLLVSGQASIKDATATHARLFGFRPEQGKEDHWFWDGQDFVSDRYGSVREQKQPAHVKGTSDFGLLQDIANLSLNMQFEDAGLRTQLRWKLR